MSGSPAVPKMSAPGLPATRTEDDVRRHVAAAIVDRRLPPGTKLVEQSLAEIFAVSRARVRAALALLAHERMVTLEPNRGARVATPSVREAHEVFAARRLVEPGIIRIASAGMDAAALNRMTAHVEAEADARRRGDRQAVIRLSGEFHLLLAGIAGNAVLLEVLEGLVSRSSLVIAVYERAGSAACTGHDHGDILDLLAAGDAEGAADAMARHMDRIAASLDLSDRDEQGVDLRRIFGGVGRAVPMACPPSGKAPGTASA